MPPRIAAAAGKARKKDTTAESIPPAATAEATTPVPPSAYQTGPSAAGSDADAAVEDERITERLIGTEATFKKAMLAGIALCAALALRRYTGPEARASNFERRTQQLQQKRSTPSAATVMLAATLNRFQAIEDDSEAPAALGCSDPSKWLNAGRFHAAAEPTAAEDGYNKAMLWGSYLSSLYFGFRTRTAPAMLAGVMLDIMILCRNYSK